MTLHRKKRLRELIRDQFDGNQRAFADRVGLTEGRVSQLVDVNHSFGERSARNIANELTLDERYFEVGYESPESGLILVDEPEVDLHNIDVETLHRSLSFHLRAVEKLTALLTNSQTTTSVNKSLPSIINPDAGRKTLVRRKLERTKDSGKSDRAALPAAKKSRRAG